MVTNYVPSAIDGNEYRTSSRRLVALVLTIFLIYFIGTRPISYFFHDMGAYNFFYMKVKWGQPFIFDWDTDNIIYDNYFNYMASNRIPVEYFFISLALIYFGAIFIACRKMFPKDTLLTLLVYLAAFSTFSFATNGMKNGCAAAVFLVAVVYRDKLWLSIPIAIITYGMHHAMVLCIAGYLVASFVRRKELYMLVWITSFFIAAFQITYFQEFFQGYLGEWDEWGAGYLEVFQEKAEGASGFRPDFIVYSAIPIFLGYYMSKRHNFQSREYDFIWCYYTLVNALFLLNTYGKFINRIAYLSWLIYPFVLIYPFLKINFSENQDRYLKYAVYGHLGFTLFMQIIYYPYIHG